MTWAESEFDSWRGSGAEFQEAELVDVLDGINDAVVEQHPESWPIG
jgi:hypothetical protein